jgi:hypothetical protein
MPDIIKPRPWGKIALSAAIAVLALVLTSFLDAAPTSDIDQATSAVEVSASRPWCGPYDAFGTRSCRYRTFEDCLATVSTISGACRPNPAALIVDDGPYRTYHSLSRVGYGASAIE